MPAANDSKGIFAESAERFGIPLVAVSYVLAFAAGLGESASKLGWRVSSILICVVCVTWAGYVWLARRPNLLDPQHRMPRFGSLAKMGATTAAVLSVFPILLSIQLHAPPPDVPFLVVKVINNTSAPANVYQYADFFLTEVETPSSERLVQAGRLKFEPREKTKGFVIPPKQWHAFDGRFRNEAALIPLLARGDLKLAVVVKTDRGEVTPHDIPFAKDDFGNLWIEIAIN